MIYHFILNPKSGRNRRHKNLDKMIKEACKKRHLDYHIYYTTCRGDATEYVSSMVRISPQEKQRFICVGGDEFKVGAPYVDAKVTAKVAKQGKGKKLTVFTYKPKKSVKRKLGHRQPYTKLEIVSIG